ncbi:MAG TPA: hypothetical protein VK421_14385 [Pyrinomonadaceae bacterium]|nr:hypothetical protein [Pyrinomonadaceae bacterium]
MSGSRAARLLLMLCALAASASAQGEDALRLKQLVVPLGGAGFVGFRLETTPDAKQGQPSGVSEVQAALLPQALLGEDNTVHRVLLDREGNVVFAYDLHVEPHAPLRRFTVTAKPLSAEFEQQLLRARRAAAPSAASSVPTLARAAGPQTLDDGDSVSLDLLFNPRTGVRVADVFKVSFDRARLWQAPPRDFTADSAQLAVRDHTLLVGGEFVAGGRAARGVAGALVWFYVPGRGRFILSLVPRDGYDFRKIATIEENRISFEFRGERYEWVSGGAVVAGGGTWHAWVLHDPDYTPEIASAEEITRGIVKEDEETEPSALKQILTGRAPARPAQPGFDTKRPDTNRAPARAPRPRIGAADRMENLLPKR